MALGGEPEVAAQVQAAASMSKLAGRIAAPWVERRQAETGLFVDPITGGAGHGYGPAMLAEALIREGARSDDRGMLRAGLRALSSNSTRAADDGRPGNPLELFAIASAYNWADRNLEGDADWGRYAPGPRRYLRSWESAAVGDAAAACFASASCWNNYKIVEAAAVLMLLRTGLEPASERSRLADPEHARAGAIATLTRDLPRAIGREGEARGRSGTLSGLGILSDQPTYPLAYHAMSVAALARALDVLGDDAPPAAREHFRAAMLAQASFMGPDGDVSFLGRAQGESWALGATAYAGESCARMFRRSHRRSAGICATLAIRALGRLTRLHGFRDGLLAIVPRFSNLPLTGEGLEHYARVMTFNGLTAMFLGWAGDEASGATTVEPLPLPLDGGGSFVDPRPCPHGGRPPRLGLVRRPYDRADRRQRPALRLRRPLAQVPQGRPLGRRAAAAPARRRRRARRRRTRARQPERARLPARRRLRRRSEQRRGRGARRLPHSGRHVGRARAGVPLRADGARREGDGDGAARKRAPLPGLPAAGLDRGRRGRRRAADADVGVAPVGGARHARVRHRLRVGQRARAAGYRRYVTVPADGRVSWTLTARQLP